MRVFRLNRLCFVKTFPLLFWVLALASQVRGAAPFDNFFDEKPAVSKTAPAQPAAVSPGAEEGQVVADLRRARFQDALVKGRALLAEKSEAPVAGMMAVAFAANDDFQQATNYAQRAVAVGETNASFHALIVTALLERRAGNIPAATNACLQAIRENPRHPIPYLTLALIHFFQADYEATLLRAREAFDLEPNLAFAQTLIGMVYRGQGKFDEALAAFAKARRLDDKDFRPQAGIAEIQLRRGQIPAAIQTCQDVLSSNPDIGPIREILARALLQTDRVSEAVTEAAAAAKSDPDSAAALQTLSRAYARQADFPMAINTLRRFVTVRTNAVEGFYMAGLFLAAQNKLEEARRTLEVASRLSNNRSETVAAQGVVEHLEGKFEPAALFLGAALATTNQNSLARASFYMANLRLSQKSWTKARDAFQQSRSLFPNAEFETLDLKALCREDHPTSSAMASLATIFLAEGLPEAAIKVSRDSFSKGTPNLVPLFIHSRILFQRRSYDEALAVLNKTTKLAPQYAPAYLATAEIQITRKEYQNAILSCKKALELQTNSVPGHYRLAGLYALVKEPQKAEGEFRELVRLIPESPIGYNDLACNLADRDERLDEALALAEKSVALAKGKTAATCLDTLGWVQFKRKDYPKALEALQSALQTTADPVLLSIIHQHFGQVYQASGTNDKAVASLRLALQHAPEGPRADEVKALLAQMQTR